MFVHFAPLTLHLNLDLLEAVIVGIVPLSPHIHETVGELHLELDKVLLQGLLAHTICQPRAAGGTGHMLQKLGVDGLHQVGDMLLEVHTERHQPGLGALLGLLGQLERQRSDCKAERAQPVLTGRGQLKECISLAGRLPSSPPWAVEFED